MTNDLSLLDRFNNSLNRLNKLTDNQYLDFKLLPFRGSHSEYLSIDNYRTTLSGLIFKLHSDFFSQEQYPITKSESGQIIFNQNISQTQNISINLFKEQIENKLKDYKEGTKERSFLNDLNNYLTTTNNLTDIFKKTIDLANKIGLSFESLSNIFS